MNTTRVIFAFPTEPSRWSISQEREAVAARWIINTLQPVCPGWPTSVFIRSLLPARSEQMGHYCQCCPLGQHGGHAKSSLPHKPHLPVLMWEKHFKRNLVSKNGGGGGEMMSIKILSLEFLYRSTLVNNLYKIFFQGEWKLFQCLVKCNYCGYLKRLDYAFINKCE